MKTSKGFIFNIQSFSLHDGPGIRTTVFLGGCPLHCQWCCNPEGTFSYPVVAHLPKKCISCGSCITACPHQGVKQDSISKKLFFDRSICSECHDFNCVEACLNQANVFNGRDYTINELMNLFYRSRHYWGFEGGVTFSGGEPFCQFEFLFELLKKCREVHIHTSIETSLQVPQEYLSKALPYLNWIFFDIKHLDSATHKKLTGIDNALILKNIRYLAESKWNGTAIPRIPIIPNINDSKKNLQKTAHFLRKLGFRVINILPYHNLGESKYNHLGKSYQLKSHPSPTPQHMENLKEIIESEDLLCYLGNNTPF